MATDETPDGNDRMNRWYVKVKRYGGGESVIAIRDTKEEADEVADGMNTSYMTDAYYAEPFNPDLAGKGFGPLPFIAGEDE